MLGQLPSVEIQASAGASSMALQRERVSGCHNRSGIVRAMSATTGTGYSASLFAATYCSESEVRPAMSQAI